MRELQRYLAEEIVEDHADGLVSRREALRRLGLLGLSGAAAASLLAGAVAKEARAAGKAGLRHQIVTFPDADHAFFNPTGSRYNAEAASAAYQRMLSWFGMHVAT